MRTRFIKIMCLFSALTLLFSYSFIPNAQSYNDKRFDTYINMGISAEKNNYQIPHMFRQDAPYTYISKFPLVVSSGVEYVPLSMFILYPYIQVNYSGMDDNFYLVNTRNGNYISFNVEQNLAYTHSGELMKMETKFFYQTRYIPARKTADALDMMCETYDDPLNGIYAFRISNGKSSKTLVDLITPFLPVKEEPEPEIVPEPEVTPKPEVEIPTENTPTTENKPETEVTPPTENKPSSENTPAVEDTPTTENKPSSEITPSTTDKTSTTETTKPSSSTSDKKPTSETTKPSSSTSTSDKKPTSETTKPSSSTTSDKKPTSETTKPSSSTTSDKKPSTETTKPSSSTTSDKKPTSETTKPSSSTSTSDKKPTTETTKPSSSTTSDKKPSTETTKPSSSTTSDKKPSTETTKPSSSTTTNKKPTTEPKPETENKPDTQQKPVPELIPVPEVPEDPIERLEERNLSLCFTGMSYTGIDRIINVLNNQRIKASFSFTKDEILSNPSLVRKLWLDGHSIMVTSNPDFNAVSAQNPDISSQQLGLLYANAYISELESANSALKLVLKTKTRMCTLPYNMPQDEDLVSVFVSALNQAGYLVYNPTVDSTDTPDSKSSSYTISAKVKNKVTGGRQKDSFDVTALFTCSDKSYYYILDIASLINKYEKMHFFKATEYTLFTSKEN